MRLIKIGFLLSSILIISCKREPLEKNTYSLSLDSVNASIKIPENFINLDNKKRNQTPYFTKYADAFNFWKENPELIVLIDSINVQNQIYVEQKMEYVTVNKKSMENWVDFYKKGMETSLRYEYRSHFEGASIGSHANFKFIKIKYHLTSDLESFPNPNQYFTQYIISTSQKSISIHFHLTQDLNTEAFIKNVKIWNMQRKKSK